jgi:hypothetical protein
MRYQDVEFIAVKLLELEFTPDLFRQIKKLERSAMQEWRKGVE